MGSANPFVDQFRRGGVPRDLRLMAAQGALPLKPADLIELLHHLMRDAEEEIRTTAAATLGALPVDELLPILKDRETPAEVLAWGFSAREEQELREVVLQNTSLPDEAIEALVASLPENQAELVVINQVRLLRRTSLLEALEKNPYLNRDQRRRLMELRQTFHIGEKEAQPTAPPAPAPAPAAAAGAAAGAGGPAGEAPPQPEPPPEEVTFASADEAVVRYLTEEERQHGDRVSAVQRLYRLNTADKVVTALKGNREERAVLIRDPNRIVATAVLGSPRVTESEIESFAGMKNVSDEILRQIGASKEWTRHYGVVASLVRNPRTPLAISLGMVSRLNPKDIKALAVDRNVPEAIRKHAQKFVRTVPGQQGGGKH
jgi:hypothetical protein